MNVFVLCTGRSGSKGFIKACQHISNYTVAHESLSDKCGKARFEFPKNHIEADNRLSWQLGQLDKFYGKKAFYVHLKREKKATAQSFMRRFLLPKSMIYAYANGIKRLPPEQLNSKERFDVCLDYVETVNSNIEHFLKDKPHQMEIELSDIKTDFESFWKAVDAEGDLDLALAEFDIKYNKSSSKVIYWRYSFKQLWLKFLMIFKS
ncbi:hypothetical protein [Flavobacterium sp. CS20]|uniref:hypothetical protein n=1 Tax=Flavobacterium sp. CS20 TaxID=2775246 RepID=UPI001B3A2A39|nr:hypothetical protein [Flavobacterium sp. CS20]QTY26011.1 hypothetical protein IGB25_08330 [Flavobacterium sp. CS20]